MALVLFCLSFVYYSTSAYTENYRAVHLALKVGDETQYTSLDLATRPISHTIAELCNQHACNASEVTNSVINWSDESFGLVCHAAYVRLLQNDDRAVSSYPTTATAMQSKSLAANVEIRQLLRGNIVPRNLCRSPPGGQAKDCKFAMLVEKYRIYPPLPLANLSFEQWSYLFEFGDDLFNLQLYHHAEAWCYYLVHNLLYYNGADNDALNTPVVHVEMSTLSPSQHKLLIRGSLLLAEVAKLKGQLEVATHHSLRAIRSHDILAAENTPLNTHTVPNFAVISRLRIQLTIPPTPPEYADAMANRSKMVQDLHIFARSIVDTNVTLSIQDLSAHIAAMPFNMAHQGLNDLDIQTAMHAVFSALCPELSHTSAHLLPPHSSTLTNKDNIEYENTVAASHPHSRDADLPDTSPPQVLSCTPSVYQGRTVCVHKVFKVGFISTKFFDHSIGRILVELLVHLNKKQVIQRGDVYYTLQIYTITLDWRIPADTAVYYNGTHLVYEDFDASTMSEDLITRLLREHMQENYIRIPDNQHTVRSVLDALRLDMLIFTDVGMDFSTYLLAYSRFAPIQAVWWGHPITTALPSIDYFISLDDEVRDADGHYGEQLVRMQHINTVPLSAPFTSRLKRQQPQISSFSPLITSALDENHGKALLELENDQKTLNSLNFTMNDDIVLVLGRLFKLHPTFDRAIAELLQMEFSDTAATSEMGSKYIVFIAESLDELNVIVFNRMVAALHVQLSDREAHRGDAANENRARELFHQYVRFIGYEHYYALLRSARVVLDTFPYGGCLTSHDALSHYVPLVTLPAEHIRGRFTLSLYREMNITSLVAANSADFVNITMRLLTDEPFWREQAEKVRAGFDAVIPTNNRKVADEWADFIVTALL